MFESIGIEMKFDPKMKIEIERDEPNSKWYKYRITYIPITLKLGAVYLLSSPGITNSQRYTIILSKPFVSLYLAWSFFQ